MITLRRANATVTISPEHGGAIASYFWMVKEQRLDWLRPTPEVTPDMPPNMFSCFPMIPFFGRIGNGRFSFSGQTITLLPTTPASPHAIHGHGWRRAWNVSRLEGNSLHLRYRHCANDWPWDYGAEYHMTLGDDGSLHQTLSLVNLSAEAMPAGLGLHPFFPRRGGECLQANVRSRWHYDADGTPLYAGQDSPVAEIQRKADVDCLAIDSVFEGWQGEATAFFPYGTVRISASPEISRAVIVARPGGNFFTFEPVTHISEAFNRAEEGDDQTGRTILSPNETLSISMTLSPVCSQAMVP